MNLFSFETLSLELTRKVRTLSITLRLSKTENCLTSLMVQELEQLFSWCSYHLEIYSIYIKSDNSLFIQNIDQKTLATFALPELTQFLLQTHKVVSAQLSLPQTVIIDLGMGASNLGLEFALGADIRLSHEDAEFSLDHLSQGLVPSSGGIDILATLVPHAFIRQWLLAGQSIPRLQLQQLGFLTHTYSSELTHRLIAQQLLEQIRAQGQTARIQSKQALLETLLPALHNNYSKTPSIARAAHSIEDWKEFVHSQQEKRASCYHDPRLVRPQAQHTTPH